MLGIRKNFLVNLIRNYCTKREYTEVEIPVPWGHIAGKWWHPTDKRPILALHGWQDNCGTFDRLIPLLDHKTGFLAIDLPGHGKSSRLPPGIYYHNMNYPILIRYISKYFKWPKTTLMGHSLGGISCYTYAMIFPDTVDFLILIDGVKPLHYKNNNKLMALGIEEQLKYDSAASSPLEPPSYSLDEIKLKMSQTNYNSIDIQNVQHITNRMIKQSSSNPEKYYITRDPRLKCRLYLNWSQEDLKEFARSITCPIFMTKALQAPYYEDKNNFYEILEILKKTSQDCQFHYVEGTHHHHLNHPENLYKLINEFLKKHDIQDRNLGGVKREIIAQA